jgi:hypothetical protein
MPNTKQIVEISNSIEQKPFPFTPSFPNIKKNPANNLSDTERQHPKKRAFFEICPRKNPPAAPPADHWPPTTNHRRLLNPPPPKQ